RQFRIAGALRSRMRLFDGHRQPLSCWKPLALEESMRIVINVVLLAAPLFAQQPPEDPMRDAMFPPELVMQHQQAISLTDEQKNYLKTELRQAQLKFPELQWALQDEVERLVAIVKQNKVDEKEAAAQLDKVLAAEREIKRAQITLLIHIKNNLTAAQQSK